jgi:hypothetical protein
MYMFTQIIPTEGQETIWARIHLDTLWECINENPYISQIITKGLQNYNYDHYYEGEICFCRVDKMSVKVSLRKHHFS